MGTQVVDCGWSEILTDAVRDIRGVVQIASPFIKEGAVKHLFAKARPESIRVITRFNLNECAQGVSDLSALRLLIESGAEVRGIKYLHAKLYVFGTERAIVTSANFTLGAWKRNHELGVVADNAEFVGSCEQYFQNLWARAGANLTLTELAEWERQITQHVAGGAPPSAAASLPDHGTDLGLPPSPIVLPTLEEEPPQAFVKFFGSSNSRADRSMTVLTEVRQSGSHWACTYPKGQRPSGVCDGAVLFFGRMVKEPNDILIYGSATGLKHVPKRDDASREDIELREWKESWPHYVRVHHASFLAGPLQNGVSLDELMVALGANAFLSTQVHANEGSGNTNPRRAYLRKPAVQLTKQATAWLQERLQAAFDQHGKLTQSELEQLDWPEVKITVGK